MASQGVTPLPPLRLDTLQPVGINILTQPNTMTQPNTPTPTQSKAAACFLRAYSALLVATAETRAKADKDLDRALATYRQAHKLSSANGFLDCINHYNATHVPA